MKILDCKPLTIKEVWKSNNEGLMYTDVYWLRSPHPHEKLKTMAAYVNVGLPEENFDDDEYYDYENEDEDYDDGSIRFEGVTKVLGVRPALYLDSNVGREFKLAGDIWYNIFENVYFCEDVVTESVFNNSLSDGNEYEGSELQKSVLSWFKSEGLEFNTEINPGKCFWQH